VISVVNVISIATQRSITIGGSCVIIKRLLAMAAANPVFPKAAAIEKPAPNKNMIS
jgi:hypothetical protein